MTKQIAPSDAAVDGIEILWRCKRLSSAEHCVLRPSNDRWQLHGVCVLPIADRPGHIDYRVDADQRWTTTSAHVRSRSCGRGTTIDVVVHDAAWTIDGEHRADLDGCVDIDLGWTPSTNLLPIRRLDLAVGERATIDTAWLRFPELTFERSTQTYTRTEPHAWRYQAGPYDFRIDVNDIGLVTRYGTDLWQAIAVAARTTQECESAGG
jgi:hypothetical protein